MSKTLIRSSDPVDSVRIRSEVFKMARGGDKDAYKLAKSMKLPWYATQSLAAVARWETSAARASRIAENSFRRALDCRDYYQRAAVSAWPLAALVERGSITAAQNAIPALLELVRREDNGASRAEAIYGLWIAAVPKSYPDFSDLHEAFVAITQEANSWRAGRAQCGVVYALQSVDPEEARRIYALMTPSRFKKFAARAFDADEAPQPYMFF